MSNVPLSEEISHFRQDFQASHGWNTDGTRISKRDLPGEAIFSVHSTFSKAIRALSLSVFNPCSIRGPRSAPSSPAQPLRPFVSRSASLVAALPLWAISGAIQIAHCSLLIGHWRPINGRLMGSLHGVWTALWDHEPF